MHVKTFNLHMHVHLFTDGPNSIIVNTFRMTDGLWFSNPMLQKGLLFTSIVHYPSFINRNALYLILNPDNRIGQERVASIKNTVSNYVIIFALHY